MNKRKLLLLLGCILIISILAMNPRVRKLCGKTWKRMFGKNKPKITTVENHKKYWKSENTKKKLPAPTPEQKPEAIILSGNVIKAKKIKATTPPPVAQKPESSQKPKSQQKPVPKKTEDDTSPFNYGAEELGGYVPLKGQRLLTDIRIKGILQLNGKEPVAVLELKNSNKTFYVRKDDVIRLNEGNGRNKGIAEVYLQVVNISGNEVEIIQQQRPDKVIIVR